MRPSQSEIVRDRDRERYRQRECTETVSVLGRTKKTLALYELNLKQFRLVKLSHTVL